MRSLRNLDFLELWEMGAGLHPLDQGLLAIQAAFPEASYQELANWPLGRRNQALAAVHCASFGPEFQCWTSCPQCGEKIEVSLDGRFVASREATSALEPVVVDGYAFRPPTSRDLARLARDGAANQNDLALAVRLLLETCRVEKDSPVEWREEFVAQVEEKLADADPLAEILLTFECPACGAVCDKPLDLPAFLWAEISSAGRRLLSEVHVLASAYGWTEPAILALSDARRASYLEMVRG
jgi:hypothetical protein